MPSTQLEDKESKARRHNNMDTPTPKAGEVNIEQQLLQQEVDPPPFSLVFKALASESHGTQ